jgi:hypothetical protein
MRVLSGELAPASGRHPDDNRDAELSSRHVAQGRRIIDDLIEGKQAEVDRHHFHNRPQSAQGRADSSSDER